MVCPKRMEESQIERLHRPIMHAPHDDPMKML
jgi:hypothetical protein